MDSNLTPKQTIPLWKWILELILGTILSAFYLWKILKSQHL